MQNPVNYTYEEAKNFTTYRKVVRLDCVKGWSVNILWEGVLVSDLIKEAWSRPPANTIIFHAVDGYTTSFLQDYVKNNQIILAYRMNSTTIPPERGYPFQLVSRVRGATVDQMGG